MHHGTKIISSIEDRHKDITDLSLRENDVSMSTINHKND